MGNKKIILGVVTGVALLSVAAIFLSKKKSLKKIKKSADRFFDAAENQVSESFHDGKHLAQKARHKAQQHFSAVKN